MNFKAKLRFGYSALKYKFTNKSNPVVVAWLITSRCNQSCTYCKWKSQRSVQELSFIQVKDMIKQMYKNGVSFISFTGGEPLLIKDIGRIIDHIKKKGMLCSMVSNGWLVQKRLQGNYCL